MDERIQASGENHYLWGGICDGWHLVRNGSLSVIEERMPPDTTEQRHFHTHARQFFYVLDGELAMEIDGQLVVLGPRQGLEIAPGRPHQAMNRSGADVRFLVISQPPSLGDRTPA
jgi:mannose-6-phosphate isomerase-like protein (cupin superfamily)